MQFSRCFVFISICVMTVSVGRKSAAENICKETVPANRFVDGFPAYSQCAASTDSSVWSSNGIHTNTTTPGSGWALTQLAGGYQCTEFVYRYLYFKWNVNFRGNGLPGEWCDETLPSTLKKTTAPVHGDLAVFAPGACDANLSTGRLAVVDTVNKTASTVTVVEQNPSGRRSCSIGAASCFLHVVTNNGASSGVGAAGVPGASGRSGGTAGVVGFAGKGASGAMVSAKGGEVGVGLGGAGVTDSAAIAGTNTDAGCSCDLTHRNGGRSNAVTLLVGVLMLAARRRSCARARRSYSRQPNAAFTSS